MPRPKLLVCVEGPIGAGKSTLLDGLAALGREDIVVLKEPVEDWKAVKVSDEQNMLGAMYTGELSSGVFQLAVLQSRFAPLVRALLDPTKKIVVSERGPWSEKVVFAQSNLPPNEFACYDYAHRSLTRDLLPIVGTIDVLFLHLEMPINDVLNRIKLRGRPEEMSITASYLKTLEEAHARLKATMATPDDLGCGTIGRVRHESADARTKPCALVAHALGRI